MGNEIIHQGDVLLYSDENGKEFVNVVFMEETFWLTQIAWQNCLTPVSPISASICHTSSRKKN